jgi:hypothetical protein
MGEAHRAGPALEHHRQGPRLVVQVQARVDVAGIGQVPAQQAEARRAGLALAVRLGLELQARARCGRPLAGQRQQVAVKWLLSRFLEH